jgi:hypothetical protein
MTKYDGSIRIDTKIDSKGFNKGVDDLVSALKPLAVAMAAIFGLKMAADVLKLAAEFERLRFSALAVGQMFGFTNSETSALVTELESLGIQSDVANKAFINFAREGLDTSLLPALARGAQDLNVFAEAGATSSDVLDRLMHGVLTLNPLILRNAGIAIEFDQAYKSFADNAGKSVSQLSLLEKRQAALAAVTEKLIGVQGLYELSQQTAAGQLASNTRLVNTFKAALGKPFQQAFYTLIKAWNDLIKIWTQAIQPGGRLYGIILNMAAAANILAGVIARVVSAIGALFGFKVVSSGAAAVDNLSGSVGGLGEASTDAAGGQGKLADATKKAAKEARGALADFDDLNVLQQDIADTADDAAGSGGGVGDFADMGAIPTGAFDLSQFDFGIEGLDERIESIKKKFEPFITRINALFIELQRAFENAQPSIKWLWDNLLLPAISYTGDALLAFLDLLVLGLQKYNDWAEKNPELNTVVIAVFGALLIAILALFSPFIAITALIAGLIIVFANAGKAWDMLIALIKLGFQVWANLLRVHKDAFFAFFESVAQRMEAFAIRISVPIENWAKMVKSYMESVGAGWSASIEKMQEKWRTGWTGMVSFVKGMLNQMIDLFNRMISGIVGGINGMVGAVNKVAGLLPGFSPIASVSAPQIPRLATGAVVPAHSNLLAMIGEGNKREIVAPEDMIRRIVREESGGSGKQEVVIRFEGTLSALVRELKPIIDRENTRTGASLIVGES